MGGPQGPPPADIRPPFLNGQRYWAVLWWLLISKRFQSIGQLRFEFFYNNFQKFLVQHTWSASILKKKIKKLLFFQFFCKNHTFSVWNWILHEKCFLLMYNMLMYVKNCEILIFHSFFSNFQYIFNYSNFLWFVEKKY